MKVAMIGSGYVGLVSGACFSEFGAYVTCIDTDKAKIDKLNNLKLPIYEPGLNSLVKKNFKDGRLIFSTQFDGIIQDSDLIFITVGTPIRKGDGHLDLKYIFQAARDIAPLLSEYTVVVNKSTAPVGTARKVKEIIKDLNSNADFDIASNPEFLREGAAIKDFMYPDRVVVGVESKKAQELIKELYRPLNLIEVPMLYTSLESAELIKYAANGFLATKISFINEIANLCETVGADVHAVSKGIGLDGRIGRKFLHPGPGFGGSCFPKDTRALTQMAKQNNTPLRVIEAAIEANESQKSVMINKIRDALAGTEKDKKVAVLGLTFKPETDDMREAPSISILSKLIDNGARVHAHDPQGIKNAKPLLPKSVQYSDSIYDIFKGADAVILFTEWNIYRGLDLERIKKLMNGNIFLDLRNVYEPDTMKSHGFSYFCVGRR
jgi:UDPglucose 6-dehydrogenase